jgi:hypothetical protein
MRACPLHNTVTSGNDSAFITPIIASKMKNPMALAALLAAVGPLGYLGMIFGVGPTRLSTLIAGLAGGAFPLVIAMFNLRTRATMRSAVLAGLAIGDNLVDRVQPPQGAKPSTRPDSLVRPARQVQAVGLCRPRAGHVAGGRFQTSVLRFAYGSVAIQGDRTFSLRPCLQPASWRQRRCEPCLRYAARRRRRHFSSSRRRARARDCARRRASCPRPARPVSCAAHR